MLRLWFTSLLLPALLTVSCGPKKKDTSEKKKVASERFADLIPAAPNRLVSDYADFYSSSQEMALEKIAVAHEDSTTNQVAVITLVADTLQVASQEEFNTLTLEWANRWGIGTKEKNNGVAIFIEPNQHMMRIQVGKGFEAKLTNGECQRIIDSVMIPLFKEADFFGGTREGLNAIINEIK
jgi:uncharacterized protein